MTRRREGYVLWKGESMIDRSGIVCIATMVSENRKTGNVVQTWIMNDDVDPVTAARQGLDFATCGDCKMRPTNVGGCYVLLFRGPQNVWKRYKNDGYIDGFPEMFNKPLRVGTYGDPAAVPLDVWKRMIYLSQRGYTGYTHQWRTRPDLCGWFQASVDTPEEYEEARHNGWGTFRCRLPGEELFADEYQCPGYCASCQMCEGTQHISIEVHGRTANRYIDWRQSDI